MAYRDLRDFMALLEKKGLLVRIKAEVDPEWEINGVTRKLQEMAGPAVLFENVGGHKVPVVCGMIGTPRHLGLALGMDTQDEKAITEEWIRRAEHPLPPKLVESGPCKENILTGDDDKINAFRDAGLSHFIFDFQRHGLDPVSESIRQMDLFVESVVPLL